MDRQRRDLHYVPYIQQEQPLTLVQVPQQHLHVQLMLITRNRRTHMRPFPHLFQVLFGDHALGDFLNNRVDAVGGTFEHRYRVLVVDEV